MTPTNPSLSITFNTQLRGGLSNAQQERFCGFLYLESAIAEAGLKHIQAAPNKLALHDRQIIYLSQYCGENKIGFPEQLKYADELATLNQKIGFIDTLMGANLRCIGDQIFVFDTEKSSFDPKVRDKIDTFTPLHNAIRLAIEKS